jgi:hypothetical protein
MQIFIVAITVALAAFYAVWVIFRRAKRKEDCSCGCSSCPSAASCEDPKKRSI